jgi:hypothetical protein
MNLVRVPLLPLFPVSFALARFSFQIGSCLMSIFLLQSRRTPSPRTQSTASSSSRRLGEPPSSKPCPAGAPRVTGAQGEDCTILQQSVSIRQARDRHHACRRCGDHCQFTRRCAGRLSGFRYWGGPVLCGCGSNSAYWPIISFENRLFV